MGDASVLLVVNDAARRRAWEDVLTPLGVRRVRAASGEAALREVAEEDFAVILIDARLARGRGGFETARRLTEHPRSRRVPLLCLAEAGARPEIVLEALAHGAVDCLREPYEPELLRAKVGALVALHRRARASEAEEAVSRGMEYRRLAESLPEIVARFDHARRHLFVNTAAVRGSGIPAEHYLGRTNAELGMPPELLVPWNDAIDRALGGEDVQFNFDFPTPRGVLSFESRMVPERDEHGRVVSALCIARDVTEQRRAEEMHRTLVDVVEQSSDFIGIADPRGRGLYINEAGRRMVGLGDEDIRGSSLLDFFRVEDKRFVEEVILPVQLREGRWEGEFRLAHSKTGAMLPVHYNAFAFKHPQTDELQGFAAIMRDITGQKRAQDALRTSEERLARLVAQFPTGVTLLMEDDAGVLRYVTASERYLAIANKREGGLLGLTPREAFPELDGQGFFELIERVHRQGETFQGMGVPASWDDNGDGVPEAHHVDFVYAPLRETGGRVEGVVVVVDVVDHRVRVEREREQLLDSEKAARGTAEEANRLKDEFLSTVSHELRTPLTSILGWVQLMRGGNLPEDKHPRALETIERNARAQGQLIEELLDVSRILAGKLRLEVEPVDLSSVVEGALESVRPAADARGVVLEAALGSAGTILGDAHRLGQVVWNLLSNSVKFTPEGGRVRAFVERRDSAVEIIVADTGQGIPPAFLPHVFERFRQAEGSTTRRHGGLGLGLSIVRHLVEMHGGEVFAESDGEGLGATFTVRLPLTTAPRREVGVPPALRAPASPEALHSPQELEGVRVLVVDDEADTRELLRALLEGSRALVFTASSAAEGLELLRSTRPALVVCDIGMPGEDGYSFITRVRALTEREGGRTPAVALTAFARAEDRARVLRAGFQQHCPKPAEPGALLSLLASMLAPGASGR